MIGLSFFFQGQKEVRGARGGAIRRSKNHGRHNSMEK
jgi:hypothetical protein